MKKTYSLKQYFNNTKATFLYNMREAKVLFILTFKEFKVRRMTKMKEKGLRVFSKDD